jgi:hypothetical protein
MIIKVSPLSSGGSGGSSTPPVEYDFTPVEGGTIQIPDTSSVIINVLLWPESDLSEVAIKLPVGLVAGRRFFIYTADNSIAQLTITTEEAGVLIANNVASMNQNDLIVFNTVSTSRKIVARVATS